MTINLSDQRTVEPRTAPQPPIADPSIIGTRCDHKQLANRLTNGATHIGCPGWWGNHPTDDPTASACACPCHAEHFGWPQWEKARAAVG